MNEFCELFLWHSVVKSSILHSTLCPSRRFWSTSWRKCGRFHSSTLMVNFEFSSTSHIPQCIFLIHSTPCWFHYPLQGSIWVPNMVIFIYQRRKNLNNLYIWIFNHEWLKSELWYAHHKFMKFYFKFQLSAGIIKNFWFILAIIQPVLLFRNKYFFILMTSTFISRKICNSAKHINLRLIYEFSQCHTLSHIKFTYFFYSAGSPLKSYVNRT